MKCQLCDRDVGNLSRHHLVPKTRGGAKQETIDVCLSCKDMIHELIDNKTLQRRYYTLELLRNAPELFNYLNWIRKQKKERVTIARKKRK